MPSHISTVPASAAPPSWFGLRTGVALADRLKLVAVYLSLYVFLDWISCLYPAAGLDLTPWNPQRGLSFALILVYGRRYLPCLFVAPMLSEFVVRGWPLPTWIELLIGSSTLAIYGGTLIFLTTPWVRFDRRLASVRDVAILAGSATLAAACTSTLYVGLLVYTHYLAPDQGIPAVARLWIGDCIGIIVLTPLLLVMAAGRLLPFRPKVDLLLSLVIASVTSMVFSVTGNLQLHLFYLMFLPIIWVALGYGLPRTILALAMTQVVTVFWLEAMHHQSGTMMEFQLLLFVLAITGLFTGAVVSEAREASMHLRSHQDAVAKVARIGSMGALGATIAHEINQPLAAIATYTDLVRREVGKDAPDVGLIAEAARKAGLQVDRAAGIIRQMRDLVRLGHHQAGRIDPALIFEESVELLQDVITQNKVRVSTRLPPDVPPVLADRIQIEQVVGNLMHNAIEAMRVLPAQQRNLRLIASAPVDGMLTMSVEDDGPGFAPQIRVDDVLSFISSKVDGLGIGLILSRTIVETHGGKLWIDRDGRGGIVRFTLRTAS